MKEELEMIRNTLVLMLPVLTFLVLSSTFNAKEDGYEKVYND